MLWSLNEPRMNAGREDDPAGRILERTGVPIRSVLVSVNINAERTPSDRQEMFEAHPVGMILMV